MDMGDFYSIVAKHVALHSFRDFLKNSKNFHSCWVFVLRLSLEEGRPLPDVETEQSEVRYPSKSINS